jgi:hypothetical protein
MVPKEWCAVALGYRVILQLVRLFSLVADLARLGGEAATVAGCEMPRGSPNGVSGNCCTSVVLADVLFGFAAAGAQTRSGPPGIPFGPLRQ